MKARGPIEPVVWIEVSLLLSEQLTTDEKLEYCAFLAAIGFALKDDSDILDFASADRAMGLSSKRGAKARELLVEKGLLRHEQAQGQNKWGAGYLRDYKTEHNCVEFWPFNKVATKDVAALRGEIVRLYHILFPYVFEKAGGKCQLCGATGADWHIDHIVPVSEGGDNKLTNLQLLCARCNMSKGNTTNGTPKSSPEAIGAY